MASAQDETQRRPGRKGRRQRVPPEELIEQAAALVEEEGPASLSLATLHERLEKRVSITAPLHHFGTMAGLYAAVARTGFDALTEALRSARERARPSRRMVLDCALTYARFALERENMYRTMHLQLLWDAIVATSDVPATSPRARSEAEWLRGAEQARDRTFGEIVIAVQLGQAAGVLRDAAPPRDLARVLTALVDGYMFQTLVERVGTEDPTEELARFVRLAINGLGLPRRR